MSGYPPFIIVPQNNTYYQPIPQNFQLPSRSLPVSIPIPAARNISSSTSASAHSGPSGQATPFKAPAHKHAHHLHSIPPREKSTRTLIIDHLLWVHCRTRFAQARAELNMTDRTGGSSSPNYIHRERPENYGEEDEAYSDGEDSEVLRTRILWLKDNEEEKLAGQDLQLAKSLRTRSESVEKVVTSMLNQPPHVHPIHPEDARNPPNSPKQNAHGTNSHPHALPNGVRLRLALVTLINDFFARQPYSPSNPRAKSYLPPGIASLLPISGYILSHENGPSHHHHIQRPNTRPHLPPTQRAQAIYAAGVDLSEAPASRCARHLYTACIVCNSSTTRPTKVTRSTSSSFAGGGGVSGWQDGGGIGSGLAKPGSHGNALRRDIGDSTNMVELLIRFLRLSALVAMELGSEAVDGRSSVDGDAMSWDDRPQRSDKGKGRATSSVPSAPSSPVNSRFSREPSKQTERERMQAFALRPSREWYMICAGLITRAVLEGYMTCGWSGLCAVETLMKIGLGLGENDKPEESEGEKAEPEVDEFAEFDPDDFPDLLESVKVLFPSLKNDPHSTDMRSKEEAEAEYEVEMEERLARFYEIAPSAPDLSTHLEDLSWQHPTEPIERAALRFFEAIAKWRGKPELETYKKKSNRSTESEGLSMDLLVNSSPIVSTLSMHPAGMRRPGIERYFLAPPSANNIVPGMMGFGGGGTKRRRDSIVGDSAKRMRQADGGYSGVL